MSHLEQQFIHQIIDAGLPRPVWQFNLKKPGKRNPYRVDFAWPDHRLLVEIHGGTFSGTGKGYRQAKGHVNGVQYQRDCYKAQEAARQAWVLIPFTAEDVETGWAVIVIREMLEGRKRE